jgi:hypothetical protein
MQYAPIVHGKEREPHWVMAEQNGGADDSSSNRARGEIIPAGVKTFAAIESFEESAKGRRFEMIPIEPNLVTVPRGWRRAYHPGKR